MCKEIKMPSQVSSSASSVVSISSRSSSKLLKRDKDEVRSRLLNKLGIFNGPANSVNTLNPAEARKTSMLRGMGLGGVILPPNYSTNTPHAPLHDSEVRSRLFNVARTSEPLKYRDEGKKMKPKQQRSRKISFDDSVDVMPIPMRSEYSDRVRSRLWSNRYEIHENATRNAVEFAAEGWDWRSVTEDDGMFVCTVSGELVHPVHCQQYYQYANQNEENSATPAENGSVATSS